MTIKTRETNSPVGPRGEKPGQAGPRGEAPGSGGNGPAASPEGNQDANSSSLETLLDKKKNGLEVGQIKTEQQEQINQMMRALQNSFGR